MTAVWEVCVLGPVEIAVGGRRAPLPGPRAARVLATLALAGGTPVGVPRLVDCVWGERPPRTAAAQLQTVVWRLRGAFADAGLPAGVLARRTTGYLLVEGAHTTDVAGFRQDVRLARVELARGQVDLAADTLRSALARWRGPALLGIEDGPLVAAAQRLEEERQRAHEQRLGLDVARGRHHGANAELRELVELFPLRESLYRTLALALYRSGRQGDALGVLRQARERLRDQLGMDPGRDTVAVEQAILRQDVALSTSGGTSELRLIERALEG
ncbi:AfsR/SARP family transcriptional regulator [Streptomyces sp. 8K308]|uniref:AfsR/SARP family transcriptional regulator n=1 Tax=Streptomyces sp. 8K308 TaxID=2530388 RepID=UPI0010525E96|nr:AfsR/SARP family transcriptional regulator [Streptomyces sp. 8K308]TDC21347.1 AfsR/SARP family transcriptional regulator [Streptomyces sp. 8K308]